MSKQGRFINGKYVEVEIPKDEETPWKETTVRVQNKPTAKEAVGDVALALCGPVGWFFGSRRIDKRAKAKKQDEILAALRQPSVQQTRQPSAIDELSKLAKLRDQGVVTEQEFQEQKQKLLRT